MKMLEEARTVSERERAIRMAMTSGMALAEIEQLLDQVDFRDA
jgi:helix-turn-helix protein